MQVAGFHPLSLVDFPGRACAVVFTQGCNLRCPFCHNAALIPRNAPSAESWKSVRLRLLERRAMVNAVVITGGEPTLQPNLEHCLRELRAYGFSIKLDTNGTQPLLLRRLLSEGLVDAVAMDIKAPFHEGMDAATGRTGIQDVMGESLGVLDEFSVAHEFRTTCHAGIDSKALAHISDSIPAHAKWILQRCRPTPQYPDSLQYGWLREILPTLQETHPSLELRGF